MNPSTSAFETAALRRRGAAINGSNWVVGERDQTHQGQPRPLELEPREQGRPPTRSVLSSGEPVQHYLPGIEIFLKYDTAAKNGCSVVACVCVGLECRER